MNDGIEAFLKGSTFQLAAMDELVDFFNTTINAEDTKFSDLEVEGYQCIQSFFIMINKGEDKIEIVEDEISSETAVGSSDPKDATAKYTPSSGDTSKTLVSYSFRKDQKTGDKKDQDDAKMIDTGSGSTTEKKTTVSTGTDPAPSSTNKQQVKSASKKDIQILVKASPDQMSGIKGLWRCLFESTNYLVQDSASKMLVQLHQNVQIGKES